MWVLSSAKCDCLLKRFIDQYLYRVLGTSVCKYEASRSRLPYDRRSNGDWCPSWVRTSERHWRLAKRRKVSLIIARHIVLVLTASTHVSLDTRMLIISSHRLCSTYPRTIRRWYRTISCVNGSPWLSNGYFVCTKREIFASIHTVKAVVIEKECNFSILITSHTWTSPQPTTLTNFLPSFVNA